MQESGLEVFRYRLEFADDRTRRSPSVGSSVETVIEVIVNQRLFCLVHRLLDCMELLGQIEARPTVLDHGDDATQVALGSPQALDDLRMALMNEGVSQGGKPIPLDRINWVR